MSFGRKIELTDDLRRKILKLYEEDELTQRFIADRLNIPIQKVQQVLREAGIHPNKKRRWS